MKACIILHNMIVEDERDSYLEYEYDTQPDAVVTPIEISRNGQIPFSDFIDNFHSMWDQNSHHQLRNDLIKHQRDIKGREDDDN